MTYAQAELPTKHSTVTTLDTQSTLDAAISLVSDDLAAVDTTIRSQLNSDVALISTLGEYIIQSGGKRLRPLILLLAAKALEYRGNDHVMLAAVIEFIHTATLLHDDVVDSSELRRGNPTANHVWGNEASVLVGDFLYSRSFEMMVSVNSMPVMNLMASTTNTIAAGEVMQLLNAHDATLTEAAYYETIYRKTARLFESAAQLGGIVSNNERHEQALAAYGRHLGSAFQMVDDLLDYQSSSSEMGKNVGDDLAEGKPTLPLIQAMQLANKADKQVIITAIENGQREKIESILSIVESTGALDYTKNAARKEAEKAKQSLADIPNTDYKKALLNLADFSVQRTF